MQCVVLTHAGRRPGVILVMGSHGELPEILGSSSRVRASSRFGGAASSFRLSPGNVKSFGLWFQAVSGYGSEQNIMGFSRLVHLVPSPSPPSRPFFLLLLYEARRYPLALIFLRRVFPGTTSFSQNSSSKPTMRVS